MYVCIERDFSKFEYGEFIRVIEVKWVNMFFFY